MKSLNPHKWYSLKLSPIISNQYSDKGQDIIKIHKFKELCMLVRLLVVSICLPLCTFLCDKSLVNKEKHRL